MTTTPAPSLTFGRWLRQARENAGYKQERAAEALGVSRSLITQWETDRLRPKLAQITAIIRLYDAPWLGDIALDEMAREAPWLRSRADIDRELYGPDQGSLFALAL